ncbi:MAG: carnitinyl-CoA dehydratase, partial [Acidimicrobiia bacterium]|nr:carnitinyl-CoA dehydratase [Acidimicrobiia bacterium]
AGASSLDLVERTEAVPMTDAYSIMRSGEVDLYERMLASSDAQEGPLAFTEKRSPRWTGS